MSKFSELRGLIEKSLDANPESWRSFFQKYKCDAQSAHPEQEIVRAFANYGEPVVVDVNSMLADSYSGWLGDSDTLASVKDTSDLLTSWMKDSLSTTKTTENTETKSEEELERQSRNTWLVIFITVLMVCCTTFFIVKRINK